MNNPPDSIKEPFFRMRHAASSSRTVPAWPMARSRQPDWLGNIPAFGLIFGISLLPTSATYVVSWPPFNGSLIHFLFVLAGMAMFALTVLGIVRTPSRGLIVATVSLSALASYGVFQSPHLDHSGILVLAWPICTLLAVPFFALGLHRLSSQSPEKYLTDIATLIAVIGAVYIAVVFVGSYFNLREGLLTTRRIGGPMGNAAMLQIVFLPALAILIEIPRARASRWPAAAACMAALVFTFSRASVVALALYFITLTVASRTVTIAHKVLICFACLILAATLTTLIGSSASERLNDFRDDARLLSLETSYTAWSERPFLGQGYSAIWPFWNRNGSMVARQLADRNDQKFVTTEFGPSLWFPHSLIGFIGAEMGLLGLLLVAILFRPLVRICFQRTAGRGVAIALLISLLVDSVTAGSFVVLPYSCLVWWLMVFAVLELASRTRSRPDSVKRITCRTGSFS